MEREFINIQYLKFCFLFFLVVGINFQSEAQEDISFTHKLVMEFHEAWNTNDLEGMVSMLQPDAFFKSPHQLQYGREEMASTVLINNPPVIKDCKTEEWHSHVEPEIAWSIGRLYCNTYNELGEIVKKGTEKTTEYTYVFSRDKNDEWKLQMLLFHE